MRVKHLTWRWVVMVMLCATPSVAAGPADVRLVEAAAEADLAEVRALIQQGEDVNAPYGDGATALHWAVHWDNPEMANLLIRAGAAVSAANDLGVTPLWLAGENGSAAMAERLVKAGANPNVALSSGETPLMAAARSGNAPLVKLLLAAGADVSAKEKRQGQTALMWAAAQKQTSVAQVLVAFGADVHARTNEWMEYVQFSGGSTLGVLGGELQLPQHRNGGYTPLMFSARSGDVETAKVLLAAGADIDEPTGSGTTPLVVAAHSGFGKFGAFLLDRGADPNLAAGGYTALHAAILRSDLGLVKALLAHGADPNALVARATPVGRSSGDYALTLSLIGGTPFWQAASYNDLEIMRALLAGGANPRLTTPDGKTALAAAVRPTGRGERRAASAATERTILEAVTLIVDQHVDVNAVDDKSGDTPLHLAATAGGARGSSSDAPLGFHSIVQYLVDKGADLHSMNYNGQTPLAAATDAGPRAASTADLLRKLGATY